MQTDSPLWRPAGRAAEIDVVGVGENSLDQLCVLGQALSSADKHELVEYDARPGGQIASAMLGCARLGLRVSYIGAIGNDSAGRRVLEPLERAGIDLSGVRRIAGASTRTAVVLIQHSDGERTVLSHRDPRLRLKPAQLEKREIERARVLHIDAVDPDLSLWAARVARSAGIAVVLDADSLWPEAERLLRCVDFPVVSREFAEELGGGNSPEACLRRLHGWGARLSVVTCGADGAAARIGDASLSAPGFEVKVQDSTGAGDAFRAGFIWALLQGHDTNHVLRTANAVAAQSCTALGAQGGLPRHSELERFLAARADP